MKDSFIYRITSVVLASLVLLSAAGIAMDLHFCQGKLKNVGVFSKAKSCHELAIRKSSEHCTKSKSSCRMISKVETDGDCKKGCCNNTLVKIETDNEIINSSINSFENESAQFTYVLFYSFSEYIPLANSPTKYLNYKPPLLDYNIPVLFQSFLI